jgi:hypothetical protein
VLDTDDTEMKVKRRVSWANSDAVTSGQAPLPDPDQRIRFLHSDREVVQASADVEINGLQYPRSPADIGSLVLPTTIKSILKRSTSDTPVLPYNNESYYNSNDALESRNGRETELEDAVEPWVNPVCDTVVEKTMLDSSELSPAPSDQIVSNEEQMKPKLSKFKAMRSQR